MSFLDLSSNTLRFFLLTQFGLNFGVRKNKIEQKDERRNGQIIYHCECVYVCVGGQLKLLMQNLFQQS